MELPFFIGVVNQIEGSLSMYSAECLTMMFAWRGTPKRLRLCLSGADCRNQRPPDLVKVTRDVTKVSCYQVCTFHASQSRDAIQDSVVQLLGVCGRASSNIASRRLEEHIYHWPNGEHNIYAGEGSVKHFRTNMVKRLAEAFWNHLWILQSRPSEFDLEEFRAYERLYVDLARLKTIDLSLIKVSYEAVKTLVAHRFPA